MGATKKKNRYARGVRARDRTFFMSQGVALPRGCIHPSAYFYPHLRIFFRPRLHLKQSRTCPLRSFLPLPSHDQILRRGVDFGFEGWEIEGRLEDRLRESNESRK